MIIVTKLNIKQILINVSAGEMDQKSRALAFVHKNSGLTPRTKQLASALPTLSTPSNGLPGKVFIHQLPFLNSPFHGYL